MGANNNYIRVLIEISSIGGLVASGVIALVLGATSLEVVKVVYMLTLMVITLLLVSYEIGSKPKYNKYSRLQGVCGEASTYLPLVIGVGVYTSITLTLIYLLSV